MNQINLLITIIINSQLELERREKEEERKCVCVCVKLALAPKIHFCCDIWTKKGMTESFLGIVAHFFAKDRKHTATLAVRNVIGPHTGCNIISIFKSVLEEWKIDKECVGKVLTDNGSNMLKAFRIRSVYRSGSRMKYLCATGPVVVLRMRKNHVIPRVN